MNNLLEIKDLTKTYHTKKEDIKAIDQLSLKVQEGEFIAIVGSSGCGKSTLLSILAGLEDKTSGSIVFNKENFTIGYMLQNDSLFDWLTILDNALLGLDVKKMKTSDNVEYVKKLLQTYDLEKFMKKYPSELSGGMKQRVG